MVGLLLSLVIGGGDGVGAVGLPLGMVELAGGGRLTGWLEGLDETSVWVRLPEGGSIGVDRAVVGKLILEDREVIGPGDTQRDVVARRSGDRLYGRIVGGDRNGLRMAWEGGSALELRWEELAWVELRRGEARAVAVEGRWVRAEFEPFEEIPGRGPDRVEGVLRAADRGEVVIDVPYLGRLTVARSRLRQLEELGSVRRLVVDPHAHHLGDRDVPDLDPVAAESDWLERRFELDAVPTGPAWLTADVVQLVGMEAPMPLAALVRQGQLRTAVWLNGVRLADLNTALKRGGDQWQRIRLSIPEGVLRTEGNRLRLEQQGTRDEPARRDNFGIRNLALEWPAEAP
jgi:hypothetical protein